MVVLKCHIAAALGFASVIAAASSVANADAHWTEPRIPGASEQALVLGRELDGDGDPDEITIRLEVIEVTEEVYPGESFSYEFTAKNPGTFFYHCHVQPDVHVLMGLVGIKESNRATRCVSPSMPTDARSSTWFPLTGSWPARLPQRPILCQLNSDLRHYATQHSF